MPTVVFDVYLLVPDIDEADEALRQHGYDTASPPEFDTVHPLEGFPTLKAPLSHLRLIPSNWDAKEEQRTISILIPADIWNGTAPQLAQAASDPDRFFPPVLVVIDSLIDAWLDAPRGYDLPSYLNVQLAYVCRCVVSVKNASFAEQLRPEHRQFHLDCLGKGSFWTLPFRDCRLQIRDSFLKGQHTHNVLECLESVPNGTLHAPKPRPGRLTNGVLGHQEGELDERPVMS